jgi:hypothetical protein
LTLAELRLVLTKSNSVKMNSSPESALGLSAANSLSEEVDSDEEEEHGHDFSVSACKQLYNNSERKKCVLFAMVVGLFGADGRRLGDTDVHPYKDMKMRKQIVPTSCWQKYAQLRSKRATFLGGNK